MDLELSQLALSHADLRIHDEVRRRRLVASVAERGQQVPVVTIADGPRLVLIDGYLRVEALRRLGRDTVCATTWALGETEALLAHHHLSVGPSRSALEQAWLLGRLREQGLSFDELSRRLCRSKSWVSRRLALVEKLPASAQARVRAGSIAPQAAMKYLVPLARANGRDCEALVEALGQARVSVREVAALYEGWRRADGTGRARLVADPHLYLRVLAAHAAETPAPERRRDDDLVSDLATLAAVASRACGRLVRDRGFLDALGAERAVHRAWRAARRAVETLDAALKEALPNARPEHPHDDPQAP